MLMGIKREDPAKIYCSVAIGNSLVEGENSNLVAAVEEDYGRPYIAGEQLAIRLVSAGFANSHIAYHNGWNANGVFSKAEELFSFDEARFKRGFTETLRRLQHPLDRRP